MSKIEWTDVTWNPVTGCTKISPGCKNCYAERMARRLSGRVGYPQIPHHFDVTLHPERLEAPLHWRKPRMVFVNSMSDLFHRDVPDTFIMQVFDVMRRAHWHTFQVLTKRAERMASMKIDWPKNVWAGVSASTQALAKRRIPWLLKINAVRFLSLEPLLSRIDFNEIWPGGLAYGDGPYVTGVHWVIVGGESGPGARPMYPDWVRGVRDQCVDAGVPFFFKQWGAWFPREQWEHNPDLILPDDDVLQYDDKTVIMPNHTVMHLVGKKRAGRLLDGVLWDEMPEVLP